MYAVQDHSRSPILVPIKAHMRLYLSDDATSKLTYVLSYTVSKLWPIIGQIFAIHMGVPHFNVPAGGDAL